ncbi:MAG: GTPase, partial [Thermoprotei archaeon]
MIKRKNIIIMGAGGRDFHNFNVLFKNDKRYNVIAFTASQIPGIENRIYPPELSGKLYPNGIPILSERNIREIISRYKVDEVILSYSDLTYEDLMYKASLVLSSGADFRLLTPFKTMLKSKKTIIAVCASRTGAGKSSVSRYISKILRKRKLKYVIIRHPMPYGNLKKEIVQRFETFEDLDKYETTIEEREEYEPHLLMKNIVYSGIDYKKILKIAEKEADIII